MQHENNYLTSAFFGGSIFGGLGGYKFSLLEINPFNYPTEIMLKVVATIICAIIGGLVGMLTKDVYTHFIQPKVNKYFKSKK